MAESNIKLTIALKDSDLDEEELDKITRNLLQQMRELDQVEQVECIVDPNPPEGNKALGGFLVGLLTAEVNPANITAVMGFLGDRLAGKPVELEVETNSKKLKVKAGNQQDLLAAIQEAEKFVAADWDIAESKEGILNG